MPVACAAKVRMVRIAAVGGRSEFRFLIIADFRTTGATSCFRED